MKSIFNLLITLTLLFSCKKSSSNLVQEPKIDIKEVTSKVDSSEVGINQYLVGDEVEAFEGEILKKQSKNNFFLNRAWQGIPSVEVSKDGVVFVAWYSGGKTEGPGNYITVSVSKDKCKTWEPNVIIVNPTVYPVRFFDPCLWKDRFGEVCLSWTKSQGTWDGNGGVWYSRLRYTDSVSFSNPKRLADGVMMNKVSYSYDKKSLLYPISVWRKEPSGTFLYRSNGIVDKIPSSISMISTVSVPLNIRNFDEHQVVQLSDNSYFLLMRCTDGVRFSVSKDLESWSSLLPFNTLGPTTSSRFFLGRLKSGKLAIVMNNSTSRTNLKIFLSDDEGKTWKYNLLLDTRNGVSYPDLTEDNDGNILVVYDIDRYNSMEINCVKFKESDVIASNTTNIQRFKFK